MRLTIITFLQVFVAIALVINAFAVFRNRDNKPVCAPEIQNLEKLSIENKDLILDLNDDVYKLLLRFRIEK